MTTRTRVHINAVLQTYSESKPHRPIQDVVKHTPIRRNALSKSVVEVLPLQTYIEVNSSLTMMGGGVIHVCILGEPRLLSCLFLSASLTPQTYQAPQLMDSKPSYRPRKWTHSQRPQILRHLRSRHLRSRHLSRGDNTRGSGCFLRILCMSETS